MKIEKLKLRQGILHDLNTTQRKEWVEKGWIDVYVELILASDPAKDPSAKHFHTLTKFTDVFPVTEHKYEGKANHPIRKVTVNIKRDLRREQ